MRDTGATSPGYYAVRELRARSVASVTAAVMLGLASALARARMEGIGVTITAYAHAMRRLGEPSHRAIENARLMAEEAFSAARQAGGHPSPQPERDVMVNKMVLWTVDAYST